MADAAVEFLLGNIQKLLVHHAKLITGVKDKLEQLKNDLCFFQAFLRETTKKRRTDGTLQVIARQIRDVVYEAEDIIDAYVTQAAKTKSHNCFVRALKKPLNLHRIATRVETIGEKVKAVWNKDRMDLATLDIRNDGASGNPPQAPRIREDNVVAFEEETSEIIGYFKENTTQLDVISIIGMLGLGKTTLARKIFRSKQVQNKFPTRLWVYVSQEFTERHIYLTILKQLPYILKNNTEQEDPRLPKTMYEHLRKEGDIFEKNDQELAQIVAKHLEKEKFLIIMDDVWTVKDWDKIQVALPKSNNVGKVLITSRHEVVALHANRQRAPYKLRLLNEEESWLLLQYEVYGKPKCPFELEELGMQIAKQCGGLPLAIVVIGGILVQKFARSDDISAKKVAWKNVSQHVIAYINEDPHRHMEKIIELSYDHLPYHLRACFLYVGMFPEDFEIPISRLIRMWIAEGFIQQQNDINLEETAENYLYELINRNLVRIYKRKSNGRVKTCRIHDMLRDFCKNQAGIENENVFQEMKWTPEGFEFPVVAIERCRRICIHSNVFNFIEEKPSGPHVRSFVCFSEENTDMSQGSIATIPTAFKLLRVLDVEPITLPKIPRDMYQLVHLCHIVLSGEFEVLPAAFSKLWNLETLIVKLKYFYSNVKIKANIWKMSQLRHLEIHGVASLPKVGKSGKEGKKLQTLGAISSRSCTEEVFGRACNLKKLNIKGDLNLLLEGKIASFNNLVRLGNLEKLKLSHFGNIELRGLPSPYQFPPKLKSLTLWVTGLDWRHMSVLGLLENLEVLKLKNYAFVGLVWETKDGGFRRLEVLHIEDTELTHWVASHHHYPRLRCLKLHYCYKLEEIPMGLADIPNFRMLEVHRCSWGAATSAIKIEKTKQQKWREQNMTDAQFKLSIIKDTY